MRLVFILILFLFLVENTNSQYITDSAKVYLITVSPGEEIYSSFGHSALRVTETRRGIDLTYGYGTFDPATPYFYEKFVLGRLLYSMSVYGFADFMEEYSSTGQEVYQQVLNLNNEEKYRLIMNLEVNYKPENRWYRYDFLYDNCSTRIRDMLEKSVSGKLEYDSSFVAKHLSFAGLLSKALEDDPWVSLGINTMLGRGAYKTAIVKDYMFLPCYLMQIAAGTKIKTGNISRPLAASPEVLLKGRIPEQKAGILTSPLFYFIVLFIITLIISYTGFRKKLSFRWFDVIIFGITGIAGLLFLVIWVWSLHRVMAGNINILWANPLNLIFLFVLLSGLKHTRWLRYTVILLFVIIISYIPIIFIVNHNFYPVPLLMDIILLTRLGFIFKKTTLDH